MLDKFLENMSLQEIEAATIPSLEELRATMDEEGALWVQQALASTPGE